MLPVLATGFATGLSLIVAIGAQNAFVLRQGLRREHLGVVIAVCAVADFLLIGLGTAGVGALVASHPRLLTAITWAGAAYLLWFAARSARSALHPVGLTPDRPTSRGSVLGTALALTFLNPHVYLDTVLMLGTLASAQGDARWVFAGGAMAASLLWFPALGLGARALARPLASPTTWRVVDGLVAVVMVALAARLLAG
ncbi:LysE/ArgO family amino acid transporter [Ornithinicoccus hortensis]|uniref:L-lysine exporter family protein LysE/ArgO n=1 Tax=Ornithinicoccus hortensis TaxID=82346 RepID=A0A542YSS4_9MICO|nr:LysE/ArgO family amino acid transporter [Ornithinicoccus hortensis]TQL51146.1 L-lysine exporter family protein LysE/ArgO [Ornithinicoccus hortensis]